MTVLKILAFIVLIAAVAWTLLKMHDYSEKKYGFPLFNFPVLAILVLGWICVFLAVYVLPDEHSMSEVFSAIKALTFPEPISNSIALVVIAFLAFVSMLVVLTVRTNILFGPVAWLFQVVAAVLVVPFLVLLIPGGKKKHRKSYRRRQTRY